MNLKTKIVSLKLISGEELVALSILPYAEEDIEESIETGFSNYIHLLYPTIISSKRNSKYHSFWIESAPESTPSIDINHIIALVDTSHSVKESYTLFLKENGIEEPQVTQTLKKVIANLGDKLARVEADPEEVNSSPKGETLH